MIVFFQDLIIKFIHKHTVRTKFNIYLYFFINIIFISISLKSVIRSCNEYFFGANNYLLFKVNYNC